MNLAKTIETLLLGEAVGFPTETVYGLGADPRSNHAVEQIFVLKGRDEGKGLPLIVDCPARIEGWIGNEEKQTQAMRQKLTERFWPGPLTIVFSPNSDATKHFSKHIFAVDGSLAVRVSSLASARSLAEALDGAITATSANPQGHPPAKTAVEVQQYFPALLVLEEVELTSKGDLPSTILDIRSLPFRILREGAISQGELQKWLMNEKG